MSGHAAISSDTGTGPDALGIEPAVSYRVDGGRLLREVARRDGGTTRSDLGAARWALRDPAREADRRLLRARRHPNWRQEQEGALRVVDLFCGLGSLSLGALEAARALGLPARVELAVDLDQAALDVLSASLGAPGAIRRGDLAATLDGEIGDAETEAERLMLANVRMRPDVCLAGPPCQGHSTLNNHTRHDDDRNDLYLRVVRFVELRRPRLLVLENVAAILSDQRGSVDRAVALLQHIGYHVDHGLVSLDDLGVAQTRRRHLLLACAAGERPLEVDAVLAAHRVEHRAARDLRWAIGDLIETTSTRPEDRPAVPTAVNADRMRVLFDEDRLDLPDAHRPDCHRLQTHTYKSMYGRLRWDRPAQTITSGFGSMGQGRYVHPSERRTLTAHEAARLQFLPDFVRLDLAPTREQRARMIGNAAPLKLSQAAVLELLR